MSIIPVPAHLEERPGELTFPVQISIGCKGKGSLHVGAYLQHHLSDILHLQSADQASYGLMRSLPHDAVFTCELFDVPHPQPLRVRAQRAVARTSCFLPLPTFRLEHLLAAVCQQSLLM